MDNPCQQWHVTNSDFMIEYLALSTFQFFCYVFPREERCKRHFVLGSFECFSLVLFNPFIGNVVTKPWKLCSLELLCYPRTTGQSLYQATKESFLEIHNAGKGGKGGNYFQNNFMMDSFDNLFVSYSQSTLPDN